MIRTCGEQAEFGTITSGHEHFSAWKDIWPESRRSYKPPLGIEREQERLIQGLLAPDRLLDVLRTCTVFMDTDSGKRVKVLCRYQQYRAARRIVERLRSGKTAEERSGVVWHTQGSGKSLTMVFVARMLRASLDLSDFKIVMVNDRIDLEEQLSATARLIGGKVNVIESTAELREHLSTDASDVNMVMVHKFMERAEEVPLTAVDDRATLQILYEGRTADTALKDKHAFDTKFEDLFRERSEEELLAIKKKYGASGDILEAEKRIEAIARDLVNHYIDNILPDGFKAQVVCHSKLAAVRYKKAIRAALANGSAERKLGPCSLSCRFLRNGINGFSNIFVRPR